MLPNERQHWDALARLEASPIRALALGDYSPGWGRASLQLLDAVLSSGTTSSTEFGPYYAMWCTDEELLFSRVMWKSPPFTSRVDIVVEATHRYPVASPPELTLLTDIPEAVIIAVSPHPDAEPPKKLKLAFHTGAARPGFPRNLEQARWIFQHVTRRTHPARPG
jgi:hypothetical protein